MAIPSGCLTWAAGMGIEVAWVLFTIIGTVVFVAVAGSDRCFFTALFTLLLTGGLVVSVFVVKVFVRHERWRAEDTFTMAMVFGALVVLPTVFAWLVTLIVRFGSRSS
jgi:membrane protein YdbS with pleckstrin-like domain